MRILILDNYDSFTWNLHHLLEPFGEVSVIRNDVITVEEASGYDRLVLSPGPGLPAEAGRMMEVVGALMPQLPMFGICLGMQAIVEHCGGSLYNQEKVRHGVEVDCIPSEPIDPLFDGLGVPFRVGLYHSWAVAERALPSLLRVTARSMDGVIMGIRHERFRTCGVQFHPESIMTPMGRRIVANWLAMSTT